MVRAFVWFFVISLCFVSCKDNTTTNDGNAKAKQSSEKVLADTEAKKMDFISDSPEVLDLKRVIAPLLGTAMVESIDVKGDHVDINYFKSFEDYDKVNPNSKFQAPTFNDYWVIGSKIEKVMVLVPAQILNSLSNINSVTLTIHSKGKATVGKMTRDDLTEFTGQTWEQLQEGWNVAIRSGIIRDPAKRAELFNKIVQ